MFIEVTVLENYGSEDGDKKITINTSFITWVWEANNGCVIEFIKPIQFFHNEKHISITVHESYQEISRQLQKRLS